MVFVAYEAWALLSTLYSIYGNALMPFFIKFSLFWTMTACFISIIMMVTLSPSKQSASAVFATFINETGWSSNVIAAIVGLINPAFGYAAIDAAIHYAEEVKDPERNIPLALMAILVLGFVSGFSFLVAAFFSVNDYSKILATTTGLPVVEMYRQAAGQAGGLALTLMLTFATVPALFDCQVATARLLWAFARDNALPYSSTLKKVNPKSGVPVQASLLVGVCLALLGCIYIGNTTAFSAFISSGLVLNNLTYATPVVINMLRGRKHFRRGKFHLSGATGWIVNGIMVAWTLFTVIFFEFPTFQPVTPANMNYTCVLLGACVLFTALWWWARGSKTYHGPIVEIVAEVAEVDENEVAHVNNVA
jgi:choline transport protein